MKAIFKEDKEFKTCYGDPPIGNFALDFDAGQRVQWDNCREKFAAKFNETIKGFFFSHPENKSQDVAAFLTKFEIVVGIDSYKTSYPLSNFCKTSKSKITWIEPSNFWIFCPIKRSLLTIILRCGMNYDMDKDNFEDSLFSEQYKENVYLRESKPAILRFMFGFTNFLGHLPVADINITVLKHGWREEFSKADEYVVRQKLILPNDEICESSIIGLDSLWI